MKKFLLFTLIFSFIGIISCSKDESTYEVSQEEKELLVKQGLIEFNKSALKTGKYKDLMNTISRKSSTDSLSQAELQVLLEDFLGDQTQEFLEIYYKLEALNLTSEEFHSIADQFEYLRLNVIEGMNKNNICCGAGTGEDILLKDFLDWVCGCEQS